MAQRISRAKQSIKSSGVALRACPRRASATRASTPSPRPLPDLQRGLRRERGDAPAARRPLERGDPPRARACTRPLPDDTEVSGLLALMLLTDARRHARTGRRRRAHPARRAGPRALGPSERSPRACARRRERWRDGSGRPVSAAGRDRGASTTRRRARGHRLAADRRALRVLLVRMSDNPMARSTTPSRAAMVEGPRAGLESLEPLDGDPRLSETTASTPCAPTCSSARATAKPRWRTTVAPPTGRRAPPSGRICSSTPPASPSAWGRECRVSAAGSASWKRRGQLGRRPPSP